MMTRLEMIEKELSKIIKDVQKAQSLVSEGQWGEAECLIEDCEEGLSIVRESIALSCGQP